MNFFFFFFERICEHWSKIVKKLSKNCQKIVKKLSKNGQKIVKKLSKNCQKIVSRWTIQILENFAIINFFFFLKEFVSTGQKLSKIVKKLSKNCQKIVKKLSKNCQKIVKKLTIQILENFAIIKFFFFFERIIKANRSPALLSLSPSLPQQDLVIPNALLEGR